MANKFRKISVEIPEHEIERVCRNKSGIKVEAIITHANVKFIVKALDGSTIKGKVTNE